MESNLLKSLSNLPGWRTRRKIVVIESDDWGSIRMPSLAVFEQLREAGLDIDRGDNLRFNTLDTLASRQDMEALFDTLSRFTDQRGHHPVFTAMSLGANPDFERIEAESFSQYHFEPFTATLARYGQSDAFALWQQGAAAGLFQAEFHGREHLNIAVWMAALQQDDAHTLAAFRQRCWGFKPKLASGVAYQAAFDVDNAATLATQRTVIDSGLALFEQLHGRPATFFVPPNGAIHQSIIDHAAERGIRYVSSPKVHREPLGQGRFRRRFRYLGMRGAHGMRYLTRNAFFEPNYPGQGFSIADCLEHIASAFQWHKPAVISTHRVNYVGGLSEANRAAGNAALGQLLTAMLAQWPEIEFMTSSQLGDTIRHDQK